MKRPARVGRDPPATRAALLEAAALEFNQAGFDATNTNAIAARAGFAPQTFYRHFKDKTDIFVAVYEYWVAEEMTELDGVRDAVAAARAVVRRHRRSLRMRRALRALSVGDTRVRRARAASRAAQIKRLQSRLAHLRGVPRSRLAASLLTIERIADAIAEAEFDDLDIDKNEALAELARVLRQTLGRKS